MKENLKSIRIMAIVLLVVIIVSQIVVFVIPQSGVYLKIATGISSLALISAMIYAIRGFGKNSAGFYSLYMLLYAFSELATLVMLIMEMADTVSGSPVMMLFTSASVIALFMLAYMKDLGKKVSFGIVVVIMVFNIISAIITIWSTASAGAIVGMPVAVIRSGQRILLAAVAYLLVSSKYADKEARGSC